MITACGAGGNGRITALRARRLARWPRFASVRRPVDLAGPRRDGSFVVAANALLPHGADIRMQSAGFVARDDFPTVTPVSTGVNRNIDAPEGG